MTTSKILTLLGVVVHVFNPRLDGLILGQKNQELKIASTTFGVQGSPELFPITWNDCCLAHGDIDKGRKGIAQTPPSHFHHYCRSSLFFLAIEIYIHFYGFDELL